MKSIYQNNQNRTCRAQTKQNKTMKIKDAAEHTQRRSRAHKEGNSDKKKENMGIETVNYLVLTAKGS